MDDLRAKKCVACEGGVPKLTVEQIVSLCPQVPGWKVSDDRKLERRFEFPDFLAAMAFVNRMAELSEAEAHHPEFAVNYSIVDVAIWTHAVGGLSENDFILAAKIGDLPLS